MVQSDIGIMGIAQSSAVVGLHRTAHRRGVVNLWDADDQGGCLGAVEDYCRIPCGSNVRG